MGCESGGGGGDGHADNGSDLLPLVVAASGDEDGCQGGEGPTDDAGHLVGVHGHDLVRGRLGLGQLCEGGWDDHHLVVLVVGGVSPLSEVVDGEDVLWLPGCGYLD